MLAELKLKMEMSLQRKTMLSNEKEKIEEEIKIENENLEKIKIQIDDFYSKLKQFSQRDQQIYIEKVFYKWSNAKISYHHYGIDRTTIWKIINKVNKSFKKE